MFMKAGELIKYLEEWAPPGASWEKDNIGLLVGKKTTEIKRIFLCLELNKRTLDEALKLNCNFIFTHHPLIFRPLKNLNFTNDIKKQLIAQLIKNDIVLYSAHTNLDFTKDGVSFELARRLKLQNVSFLEYEEANQYKLVVFVPQNYSEKVSSALFLSGAGIIGDYSNCSYYGEGTGTFLGNNFTNPKFGKKLKLEKVKEFRLEFLVNKWKLNNVLTALKNSHPYEEPAYDIYPLKNKNVNYGVGAIGNLKEPMTEKNFLSFLSKSINSKNIRYCKGKKNKVSRIAVCGGSCSDKYKAAISAGADAFVTADVGYHTFEEAQGNILLVDAGHYETEVHSIDAVERKLKKFLKLNNSKIELFKFKGNTNPVKFLKI
jgi:dinuclear metal center YbgI/SA1388 family protein